MDQQKNILMVQWWHVNGKQHRLDGPAVEWNNGYIQYWIEDEYFPTKEQFDKVAYCYLNKLENYI